ncbi:hypothetical protein GCM10009095_06490 [Sphingomonas molluscorum]|nr:hypothetical protein GCM10017606_16940 [Microbacterium terregens]
MGLLAQAAPFVAGDAPLRRVPSEAARGVRGTSFRSAAVIANSMFGTGRRIVESARPLMLCGPTSHHVVGCQRGPARSRKLGEGGRRFKCVQLQPAPAATGNGWRAVQERLG